MNEFLPLREQIQEAIIEMEFDPLVMTPCECGKSIREYRCYDCGRLDVLCKGCLKDKHLFSPFHWAEQWTGSYFKRVELKDIGLVIRLGHRGKRCNSVAEDNTRDFSVTHVNGIHKCCIAFCGCGEKESEVIQLIRYGLFPGSVRLPQIAFTHIVLRNFHVHTTVSKKSGFDYIESLRKLSNNYVSTAVSCLKCY